MSFVSSLFYIHFSLFFSYSFSFLFLFRIDSSIMYFWSRVLKKMVPTSICHFFQIELIGMAESLWGKILCFLLIVPAIVSDVCCMMYRRSSSISILAFNFIRFNFVLVFFFLFLCFVALFFLTFS